jgi:TolB-like protein/DNA-binding winged helix-turn-helix (wHTH) protein/tetratricopeptide (TPR) repeat protein
MQKLSHQTYFFDEFMLDVTRGCLRRGREEIKLRPKSFEALKYLVENNGRLISKDELIHAVWVETAVTDDSLVKCLKDIRHALSDEAQQIIKTVHGRGYIFDKEVTDNGSAPITTYTEDAAGVQVIIEEEETNGHGVIDASNYPATPSVGLIAAHKGTRIERLTTAIKHHKWSAVVGLVALATVTASVIYFTRLGEAIDSVAVMPFVNVSGDAETEYLSDGLSDSIINNLSQLPSLKKVISFNSVLRYKGKQTDPQAVGRELGVRAVLMGRLIQRGDDLSISVELVDVRDSRHLWGGQYNYKLADIVTVQTEIAQEVSEKLRLHLTGGEQQRLAKRETLNPQAYELLLKGRFYRNKGGTENQKKAVEHYQQAIVVDPNYALAYAELSVSYVNLIGISSLDPQEFTPKSEAAARKALELDDSLAEAHYALANLKQDAWEWATAEREYKRALELNPNLAGAHSQYAYYLSIVGRHEQAMAETKRARELDPLSPAFNGFIGQALFFARQYDEAIEAFKKARELDQNHPIPHLYLGYTYAAKGMYKEAIAEYQEAIKLGISADNPSVQLYLGAAYAKAGEPERAQAILKRLQAIKVYVSPSELAVLYAALGERERAFASLERAHAAHDLQLKYLGIDPAFDLLRSDQRFTDLLRRMKLAP